MSLQKTPEVFRRLIVIHQSDATYDNRTAREYREGKG